VNALAGAVGGGVEVQSGGAVWGETLLGGGGGGGRVEQGAVCETTRAVRGGDTEREKERVRGGGFVSPVLTELSGAEAASSHLYWRSWAARRRLRLAFSHSSLLRPNHSSTSLVTSRSLQQNLKQFSINISYVSLFLNCVWTVTHFKMIIRIAKHFEDHVDQIFSPCHMAGKKIFFT